MCQKIIGFYAKILGVLDTLEPTMLLVIRLWMANVFFVSGWLKVNNWENTLLLFTYEHPVPLMPPYMAAMMGTFFELACPVALALGLLSRLATLPMLAMTAVIQFTYLDNIQHYYWAMLLGTLLFVGPGKWSLDYVLSSRKPALSGHY